jgi:hypothetical protein
MTGPLAWRTPALGDIDETGRGLGRLAAPALSLGC